MLDKMNGSVHVSGKDSGNARLVAMFLSFIHGLHSELTMEAAWAYVEKSFHQEVEGETIGLKHFLHQCQRWNEFAPTSDLDIHTCISQQNTVAAFYTVSGKTVKGAKFHNTDLACGGRSYAVRHIGFFRISPNGLILSMATRQDSARAALGLTPIAHIPKKVESISEKPCILPESLKKDSPEATVVNLLSAAFNPVAEEMTIDTLRPYVESDAAFQFSSHGNIVLYDQAVGMLSSWNAICASERLVIHEVVSSDISDSAYGVAIHFTFFGHMNENAEYGMELERVGRENVALVGMVIAHVQKSDHRISFLASRYDNPRNLLHLAQKGQKTQAPVKGKLKKIDYVSLSHQIADVLPHGMEKERLF
eukprot:GCRY01001806.1.p2 GENE.GCRY01001806.1~~GCRY01001806.1.p2  ORF type:complete len:364 (-),score=96.78 GCRY01001806.1:308-1399(-)